MLKPRAFLLMVALFAADAGRAQMACTGSTLRMIDEARAMGDVTQASHALEAAANRCIGSCDVYEAVADAYNAIGNGRQADQYHRYAAEYGCKAEAKNIPRQTPAFPQVLNVNVPAQRSYVRQKWALVVGIDKFKSKEIPALTLSSKDARDFANALLDVNVGRFNPQTVKLLLNEEATVGQIRSAINYIATNARSDDLVVLYFSTHGSSADMDVATDAGRTGYIIAYDTDVHDLYATAFPMDEMKRVVDFRFKAGRVVTFLDTCYSGDTVAHGAKGITTTIPPDSIARIAQGTGRVVIASSRSDEQSWECEQFQNSCFTHFLISAMKTKDGKATVSDIYGHLQLDVPGVVQREKQAHQNPIMLPDSGKIDIVIGTPIQ